MFLLLNFFTAQRRARWNVKAGSSAELTATTAHATSREDADSRRSNDAASSRTSHDDDRNWLQCRRVARSLVGTPNYIAPEVLSQSGDLRLVIAYTVL